jgi:hypothetical protein
VERRIFFACRPHAGPRLRHPAACPSAPRVIASREEASMVQPCRAAATGRRRVTPSSSKGPAAGHGSRLLTAVS